MNSTSNGITRIEVGQLIVCILGFILGLIGIGTLKPVVCIIGLLMLLGGFACFALQQMLGD
jgi:predicted cobalt transporter CbtA